MGTTETEELVKLCDQLAGQCGGFDSNGFLYNDVSKLSHTTAVSTFLKQPGVLPAHAPSNLWPLPQMQAHGSTSYTVSTPFQFSSNINSDLLKKAFARYNDLIFDHKASSTNLKVGATVSSASFSVSSSDETLQLGTDESYTLIIDTSGAKVTSKTVYGALRALETLSQLIEFDFDLHSYVIRNAPWNIKDAPKFAHRGILIDTSRHFLPIRTVKKIIDSLSYAKLNVLHWHLVDCQSFPVESKKFPKLWEGSWSKRERYTQEDLKDVVQYAKERGVRVMPEFDGPGHMYSWGIGYPELLPANYGQNPSCEAICPVNPCDVPIDPSNNKTYSMLQGFLQEMTGGSASSGIFPDDFLHLGGDEVEDGCWAESAQIKQFMTKNNMTSYDQLYMFYIKRIHDTAVSYGRTPVHWEEVFNHFGTQLDQKTVIHVWLDHQTLSRVVSAGYRGILSNQDVWYLDHLDTPWTSFYENDPLYNITKNPQLVVGGESCMWGETVDPCDVFDRIWPRAAATAERLWNYDVANQANAAELALPRLHHFRCRLLERGIEAAPVYSAVPNQPSSCYFS